VSIPYGYAEEEVSIIINAGVNAKKAQVNAGNTPIVRG
jgi:hypothetical protein